MTQCLQYCKETRIKYIFDSLPETSTDTSKAQCENNFSEHSEAWQHTGTLTHDRLLGKMYSVLFDQCLISFTVHVTGIEVFPSSLFLST